jgi:phosphoglycerol transferase MdoB-like AlkP superfamily enzyme
MTDQTVGLPTGVSRVARLRSLAGKLLRSIELRQRTAWALALLIGAALLRYFWSDEGSLYNIVFTAAVTLALISLVVVLSGRVLFATALTASLIAVVVAIAAAKRAAMNMVLHAYDFFFYLSSWSTLSYLWSDHRRYLVALAAALLVASFAAWLAYRADPTRLPARHAAAVMLLSAGLAWYGAYAKGERRHMQFYYENLYVSSFYASWGETIEALWRGALLEAAPRAALAGHAFTVPRSCDPGAKPPHIILIHQESVVQPSLFPSLRYDHSVDPLFRSYDNGLYQLRVETYGGASWLTEFSLLAGVSTHSFGGMRQFVQTFTQNKLKDTLPQALERCGYRNVVFYPMLRNFVSNDKFYASIGLKEIFDIKSQGAKSAQERDRFYYGNALAEMERHFKSSRKPLFTYIQTMSAHWPYDYAFEPQVDVPGGLAGTNPEMHEYLRRVSMARIDFDFLMGELRRRFPAERFLIVHYGDHHPTATRTLLGFDSDTEAEDVVLSPDSIGFITYYAVRGVNYRVPALHQFEALDVPYLGTAILDLAQLPLSDSHKERKRLMLLCRGRYHGCAAREEILAFHRRLIESGVMAAH